MNHDILLVDGNSLSHRAGSVLFLKNEKGESTSVAFGVLNMIRSVIERFEVGEICVCWDLKGSKIKKAIYPEYKAGRHDAMPYEEYYDILKQIEDLVTILPAFGIKQVRKEGVEADDAIGILSKEFGRRKRSTLILSSDKDLWQLISVDIDVYYTPKDFVLTIENFKEKAEDDSLLLEMTPNDFLFYKTVKGDMGDNIRGLTGFGKVTTKKLINKFGPWIEWFDSNNQAKPEVLNALNKAQKSVLQSEMVLDVLTRNYSLMNLNLEGSDEFYAILAAYDNQNPIFNEMTIRTYFLEKQFNSFMNRFHGFIHPFRAVFLRRKRDEVKDGKEES